MLNVRMTKKKKKPSHFSKSGVQIISCSLQMAPSQRFGTDLKDSLSKRVQYFYTPGENIYSNDTPRHDHPLACRVLLAKSILSKNTIAKNS